MVERPAVMNGSETEAQLKRQTVELEVEEIFTRMDRIRTYLYILVRT